jgi:hypothetical protein
LWIESRIIKRLGFQAKKVKAVILLLKR